MERFFHYCCRHSAQLITARGFLRPHGADQFGVALVWLTDQSVPDREGLGLTSHIQPCDRLEFQYVADVLAGDVEPWIASDLRRRLIQRDSTFHEFEDGRRPDTWFIARRHLYAIRNRTYRGPTP
jgi:hypothetical protein